MPEQADKTPEQLILELNRVVRDQKYALDGLHADISNYIDAMRTIRTMLQAFRETYPYDSREAGVIDLISEYTRERLAFLDRTEIPF